MLPEYTAGLIFRRLMPQIFPVSGSLVYFLVFGITLNVSFHGVSRISML